MTNEDIIKELEEELFLSEVNNIENLLHFLEKTDLETLSHFTTLSKEYINNVLLDCIEDGNPGYVSTIVSDWDETKSITYDKKKVQ